RTNSKARRSSSRSRRERRSSSPRAPTAARGSSGPTATSSRARSWPRSSRVLAREPFRLHSRRLSWRHLPLHTREGERSRWNVAILMMFEADSTEEQYHAVNAAMGIHGDEDAPDGLISHQAGRTDGKVLVVDVWESDEKLRKFFDERLGAALASAGVAAGEPTILPVHNMIEQGAGTHAGVLVLIDAAGF